MNDFSTLWRQLVPLYDEREAQALVRTVLEERHGLSLTDILCGKVNELSAEAYMGLQKIIDRLAQGEPVQYILGTACFAGRTFRVTPDVLIPRIETTELCQWIAQDGQHNGITTPHILDIGTGSGAIAITLALDLFTAHVEAWDISIHALNVAQANAKALHATVRFMQQDMLHAPNNRDKWDIIVSNPPYIHPQEAKDMERNVLEHEPALALFSSDDHPLVYYEAIAQYANKALKPGGRLYLEINPLDVNELKTMLQQTGFGQIEIKNDMFGAQRMMKAVNQRRQTEIQKRQTEIIS